MIILSSNDIRLLCSTSIFLQLSIFYFIYFIFFYKPIDIFKIGPSVVNVPGEEYIAYWIMFVRYEIYSDMVKTVLPSTETPLSKNILNKMNAEHFLFLVLDYKHDWIMVLQICVGDTQRLDAASGSILPHLAAASFNPSLR